MRPLVRMFLVDMGRRIGSGCWKFRGDMIPRVCLVGCSLVDSKSEVFE